MLLYHEQQEAALCAKHCLNALLQGPMFTEWDLAQLAHELDAMEHTFMAEAGMHTDDYKKYAAEGSGNVSGDGMFSIQVLDKALACWELSAVPLTHPDARHIATDCARAAGYICNLQEHWFTVRPVAGQWWNFNSLFPAPAPLSTTYLDAFLNTLKAEGWSIYVVRGSLPAAVTEAATADAARLFTPEQARRLTTEAEAARRHGGAKRVWEDAVSRASKGGRSMLLRKRAVGAAAAGDDDDDNDEALQEAYLASLADGPPAMAPPNEDEELAAAIAASLADRLPAAGAGCSHAPSCSGPHDASSPQPPAIGTAGRDELAERCETMQPEPEAGPGVCAVSFRLPNSQQLARRFQAKQRVAELWQWLHSHGWQRTGHRICFVFPRKVLDDGSITLADAGVGPRERLILEKL